MAVSCKEWSSPFNYNYVRCGGHNSVVTAISVFLANPSLGYRQTNTCKYYVYIYIFNMFPHWVKYHELSGLFIYIYIYPHLYHLWRGSKKLTK